MHRRLMAVGLAALLVAALAAAWRLYPAKGLSGEDVAALYATPLAPPAGPLRVFHLGHSLVGRDMPAMLEQLAGAGHRHDSQLGWGTSLREHWEPDLPINGFEVENDHPRYRDAIEAVTSGTYDAIVLTEMVEITDAIKYHDSGRYLAKWAALARDANPGVRVYLYESWPRLDDPKGWLDRLDHDLAEYCEGRILLHDGRALLSRPPVHMIPAGQVMALVVRRIEAMGGLENLRSRQDLFVRLPDGTLDPIHVNDLGAYLVALTHYAVLYHRSPVGLPHRLTRADGTDAEAPGPQVAQLMQHSVWDVVTGYDKTGVAR